jgi:general stress protein YciG
MTTKAIRGFALLTPERRAEISRKGGMSVPAEKRTYSIDKSKASESGIKGGQNRAKAGWERKKHLLDREG